MYCLDISKKVTVGCLCSTVGLKHSCRLQGSGKHGASPLACALPAEPFWATLLLGHASSSCKYQHQHGQDYSGRSASYMTEYGCMAMLRNSLDVYNHTEHLSKKKLYLVVAQLIRRREHRLRRLRGSPLVLQIEAQAACAVIHCE